MKGDEKMSHVMINIMKSFLITLLYVVITTAVFVIGVSLFNYSPLMLMVVVFIGLVALNYGDVKSKNRNKKKRLVEGEVK